MPPTPVLHQQCQSVIPPDMIKLILLALFCAVGLDVILGKDPSLVIKEGKIYCDDKPLDLTTLEVVEDLPYATTYLYQTPTTNITITKSKFSNAVKVATVHKMTPEEAKEAEKKAAEAAAKLAKKITDQVATIQNDIDNQIKAMNEKLNENFKNMFSSFSFF